MFFSCLWRDGSFLISRCCSHSEAATTLRGKFIMLKGRARWEWKIWLIKEFVAIQTGGDFFPPTLRRKICVNFFVSKIYLTSNLPFLKVSFKGIKSIHNVVQPTSLSIFRTYIDIRDFELLGWPSLLNTFKTLFVSYTSYLFFKIYFLIIAKIWKKPECPSADEWIKET